ncbi:MAG: peptidylprolyl isomerase [Candidatus Sulfopaludibacter sp.]|nr:peptidylprolyl isomerase [Candidatus Sulfopaludibacter sp.]
MSFRRYFLILTLAASGAYAQANEPRAVVNGKTVFLSELEGLYGQLPPELQNNPEQMFRYYGFLDLMAAKGEAAKLYDQSPYKERLALFRKQTLAEAAMQEFENNLDITDAEVKEYYEKHKSEFDVAAVQALLVPIKSKEDVPAATAKAQQIAPQLKDGTNMAVLFAQFPANLTSIRNGDAAVPAAVRKAVFALKPGEVTAPIAGPNGVYVIRLDKVSPVNAEQAKPYVRKSIADTRLQAFLEDVRKSVTVTPLKAPGENH